MKALFGACVSRLVVFIALTAVYATSPAYAVQVIYSYSGTVDPGQIDAQGYFGTPGEDISLKSFVAKFTYDTARGVISSTTQGQELKGGQYYNTSSPHISASLEINGARVDAVTLYRSLHVSQSGFATDFVDGFNSANPLLIPYTRYDSLNAQVSGYNLPTSVAVPLAISASGSGSFTRYFESYQGNNSYYQTLAEQINFSISHISAVASETAPSPSNVVLADLSNAAYTHQSQTERSQGYLLLPDSVAHGEGFAASAYQNGNQIVITVRGTQPQALGGFKDAIADRSFVNGVPSTSLALYTQDAANFIKSVVAEHPGAEITLTGHSLGGAVADIVGAASGIRTVSFDAPGAAGLLPVLGVQLCLVDGYCGGTAPDVTELRLWGDAVSLTGEHIGGVATIHPNDATDAGTEGLFDALDNHSIGKLSDALAAGAVSEAGETGPGALINIIGLGTLQLLSIVSLPVEVFADIFLDPSSAGGYTFSESSGSPFLNTLELPSIYGVSRYGVSSLIGGNWGQISYVDPRNTFIFGDEVSGLQLFAYGRLGNQINTTDSLIFDITFRSSGILNATLATLPRIATGGIPEPACWAYLVAGFGVIGALMRRRRDALVQ